MGDLNFTRKPYLIKQFLFSVEVCVFITKCEKTVFQPEYMLGARPFLYC